MNAKSAAVRSISEAHSFKDDRRPRPVPQLHLRQLEVFHAVMQAGTVSRAARLLGVSQPAVSRLLRLTEDLLGFRLFDRIRGRLVATAEARSLLPEVEQLFGSLQRIERIAGDMRDARTGGLRVAAPPSLGDGVLPAAILRFREARPEVVIESSVTPVQQVTELAVSQSIDLGLVFAAVEEPAIESEPVYEGSMLCALPEGHRLAGRRAVTAADLRDEPLIGYAPRVPLSEVVAESFARAGIEPNVVIEVNSGALACALVARGAGVAVVEEFAARGSPWPELALRPFQPRVAVGLHALYPRFRPGSLITKEFVAQVKAVIDEMDAPTTKRRRQR